MKALPRIIKNFKKASHFFTGKKNLKNKKIFKQFKIDTRGNDAFNSKWEPLKVYFLSTKNTAERKISAARRNPIMIENLPYMQKTNVKNMNL